MAEEAYQDIPGFMRLVMFYTFTTEKRFISMTDDDIIAYKEELEDKFKDIVACSFNFPWKVEKDKTDLIDAFAGLVHNYKFELTDKLFKYVRDYIKALKEENGRKVLEQAQFRENFQSRMRSALAHKISHIKDKKERTALQKAKITTSYDSAADAYYFNCDKPCDVGKIRADVANGRSDGLDVKTQNFVTHYIKFHIK